MNFKIFDGRSSFYQWDLNQKLIVDGITLNDKIHFKNIDGTGALVVKPYNYSGKIVVDVPNILLQKANSITVWVYVDNEYTKEQAVFNVIPRQKPADYIYTPTEVSVWKVLEEAVENIPNEYAKKNHVHSQYLIAETDPSVGEWAKKGSEYNITGNPVTLENIEHMPMKVVTTLEPVQAGSGEAAPDNIRPISGWTGAKMTRTGKNLFSGSPNKTISNGITLEKDRGSEVTVYGSAAITLGMRVFETQLPAGTYTFSIGEIGNVNRFEPCIDGTPISQLWSGDTWTLTLETAAAVGLNMIVYKGSDCGTEDNPTRVKIQLETGSIATEYEPYRGEAYSAEFGQTVYGGRMDWLTGKLVAEWEKAPGKMTRGAIDSRGKLYLISGTPTSIKQQMNGYADNNPHVLCSALPYKALENARASGKPCISQYGSSVYIGGYVGREAELDALLASDDFEIVYKLATPIEIQLSPHEIEALQGTNTLYGDGSLNVSGSKDVYWLAGNLAERLKKCECGDVYELIESITADGSVISRTAEPNGTTYNFKAVMVRMIVPASVASTSSVIVSTYIGSDYFNTYVDAVSNNTTERDAFVWVEKDRGWWRTRHEKITAGRSIGTVSTDTKKYSGKAITKIATQAAVTAGVKFEIWGVRA